MYLLCSDLDNTLIYSYKREIGAEKILVEEKEGKELSFMTKKSVQLLSDLQTKLVFVPVTTRSLEQYQRITFHPDWVPPYALVSNGGILLQNNQVDATWYEESLALIAPAEKALQQSMKRLSQDDDVSMEVRKVDDLFVFTKSNQVEKTIKKLQSELQGEQVQVFSNGSKVYVVPDVLSKGMAVERFRKRYEHPTVLSAGDSLFDIPMLAKADQCFVPHTFSPENLAQLPHPLVAEKDKIFSDVFLQEITTQLE